MVDTAEQAKQIVRAAKYPPEGIRGLGTSMARAANWNRTADYLHKANDEICVIVQVETQAGIDNIEEIVQVEGLDGVFIGPSDLSAAMGHIGNPGHPDVVAAVERGFAVITAADKAAGVLAVTPELVEKYQQAGAKFIGVGVDAALLANATKQLASQYIKDVDDKDSAGY
jgi:4-hydroxy-2-oxoheptanedioate aldolase